MEEICYILLHLRATKTLLTQYSPMELTSNSVLRIVKPLTQCVIFLAKELNLTKKESDMFSFAHAR